MTALDPGAVHPTHSTGTGSPQQGGDPSTTPALTVITVTASTFAVVRRTVRYLREQSIAGQIELILVGPDAAAWADMRPNEVAGFHGWRCVEVGVIEEIELGFAAALEFIRAPVVALLENHVFCDPDWAEAIVRRHEGPWSAVGSVIRNANGASMASWVEHFLTYGFHDAVTPGGETGHISRNNITFKTEILRNEDLAGPRDRAEHLLARDGGLLALLRARGHRFFREVDARMDHLNPSKASAVLEMRIPSARAAAGTRARTGSWSRARRWLYVAASPLFPLLRLRALWPVLRKHPDRPSLWRLAPLFSLGLLADAVGQAAGFAFGPGSAARDTGFYDLDRRMFLIESDRERFVDDVRSSH